MRRGTGWIATLLTLGSLNAAGAMAADAAKDLVFGVIDRNVQQMTDISDSLFYFGELGMQEHESTGLLKNTLDAAGFKTELGGVGMPTNLWAEYGSGRPKIAIVTEVDALPTGSQTPLAFDRKPLVEGAPGHMEGHNTHGGVASLAAFAVKEAMRRYNIPGTVAISFGPAEEQLASRPFIVRAGYFKDVDAVIFLHIRDALQTAHGENYAAISSTFTFHGKTAHASVNPWDGKDAVDAVELMDLGFDKLREHLRPTYRGHRTITNGGVQPNIIADTGQIWWFVRDATMPAAKETYDKLLKIAEGASLMTGTTWDVKYRASAWPHLNNAAISEAIQANIDAVGVPKWTQDEQKLARDFQQSAGVAAVGLRTAPVPSGAGVQNTSSNDSGDVSWVVPGASLNFPAAVPGVEFHEWHAAVMPVSSIAHKGQVAGAKALAASILDLMTSPDVLKKAREQFEADLKKTPYFSLLPPDAKPETDMNRAEMEKYRPEMRRFFGKIPALQLKPAVKIHSDPVSSLREP